MNTSPCRILVIGQENLATTTGGAISVFRQFCHVLAHNGYAVTAACHSECPDTPAWLDPSVRFVNFRSCYGEALPFRKGIHRLVAEIRPSLIVFFFPHLYRMARLEKAWDSIPRILMFHSRPDYYFALFPHLKRNLRRNYVNTHALILAESYRKLLPGYIRRCPVSVIPNPVPMPQEEARYHSEHKKMVYFSRIDAGKGMELLIDAMALVARKHPDWSVDVFGQVDPEGYHRHLQELIGQKGLERQVVLKGLSPLSAGATLVQYDFCLFPSRFEGFSVGLAETLAVGLPAVGLKSCSGVNEMIRDGENGLLCDDTPESLAQAACTLIEQADLRERMGRNARQWARRYEPQKVEAQWLDLVDRLVHASPEYPLLPVKKLIRMFHVKY